jgi:hypothetical protein
MGQIDISMLEKLARHWSIQKTGNIMFVIAGSVWRITISVGIIDLFG